MATTHPESAADPKALSAALPAPPAGWTRAEENGGIVEYRLPEDEGICAAAKVTVRPALLSEAAVRVDRKQRCQTVGQSRYDRLEAAVDAVRADLERAGEDLQEA